MLESQLPKLVPLLLAADQREQALALFANERWLRLRVEEFGFEHLLEDARLMLSASVKCGRDDEFVRLVLRVNHAARTLRPAWNDGSAAVAIVAANSPRRVRGLLRALGPTGTPWASFLAILRLLDLGAVTAANSLLREISEEHWPGYRPSGSADGLPGWADFDVDPVLYFLRRVMAASPELAASIVCRLYENQRATVVPNVWSVWAALLEQLVLADAPSTHTIAAIELVHKTVLPHSTGLADVLVRLCDARQRAIEAVTDKTDVSWLLREIQISAQIFDYAARAVGDNENRKRSLFASLLIHFVRVSERVHSQEFRDAIDKTVTLIRECCSIPPVPDRHEFGDRSEILARYAFALEAIGHPGSREAAEAALGAADLDARSNDPPLRHVARGIDWLKRSNLRGIAERATRLQQELKLSPTSPMPDETVWRPSVDSLDPFEKGLALLEGHPAKMLPHKGSRRRSRAEKAEASETIADGIRRALIRVWPVTASAMAIEEVRRLDAARSETSRAEFEIDLGALRRTVAKHAKQEGNIKEAATLLETCVTEALQHDDVRIAGSGIADLALFDCENADRLLTACQARYPKAASILAAVVVIALTRSDDSSIADRFASRMTTRKGRLKDYELWLIFSCGRHPQLARHIEPLVARCIDQLEVDVAEVLKEAPGDSCRTFCDDDERVTRIAECVATLSGCGEVKSEVQDRLVAVLRELSHRLRKVDDHLSTGQSFLRPLIERRIDVQRREAAQFYIDLIGTPTANLLFPATLSGLDVFPDVASALFDADPVRAHDIASQAFSVARKVVSSMPTSGDTALRAGALLLETLARNDESFAVRSADDFVAAAEAWASKIGSNKVAQCLDELADAASDETVKAVLRAGASGLHLRAGDLSSAESALLSLPSSVLRRLDVLAQLPDASDQFAWSRSILAERIGELLPGPDLDVDWLRKLFATGISSLLPVEAGSRLRAIEAALLSEE